MQRTGRRESTGGWQGGPTGAAGEREKAWGSAGAPQTLTGTAAARAAAAPGGAAGVARPAVLPSDTRPAALRGRGIGCEEARRARPAGRGRTCASTVRGVACGTLRGRRARRRRASGQESCPGAVHCQWRRLTRHAVGQREPVGAGGAVGRGATGLLHVRLQRRKVGSQAAQPVELVPAAGGMR